jgi:hypothetical protein
VLEDWVTVAVLPAWASSDMAVNMTKVSVGSMTVVPMERLTDEELEFCLGLPEKGLAIPGAPPATSEIRGSCANGRKRNEATTVK